MRTLEVDKAAWREESVGKYREEGRMVCKGLVDSNKEDVGRANQL